MRPVLRPGAALLRRDRAHLQLGVEPGQAVVLPDSPTVQDLLGRLDGLCARDRVVASCRDAGRAAEVLDTLVAAGLVVDADEVRAAHTPGELAYLLARGTADDAAHRLRRRAEATVGLLAGGERQESLLAVIGSLLTASGFGGLVTSDIVAAAVPPGSWRHRLPPAHPPPDATVVVGAPVTSASTEALVLADVPHLVVSVVDAVAVVGPFVRPGRTACLSCIDRVLAARDPAWPALLDQLRLPGPVAGGPADLPVPRSPVLDAAATTLAAREVLAHLAGEPVLTYDASLRFSADLVEQVLHRWHLHPDCGCCLLT